MANKSVLQKRALRKVIPCVYLLIRSHVVVYVGQTLFPEERILKHKYEKRKIFDRHRIIKCDINDLNLVEQSLIERFEPMYNTINYVPYCWLSRYLELKNEMQIVEEYIKQQNQS